MQQAELPPQTAQDDPVDPVDPVDQVDPETTAQSVLADRSLETLDRLGRPLRDLRISVTDRCNFRCAYCMPKEVFGRDYQFLPRDEILSLEEIDRLAGAFISLGVHKLRITGGEPTVRRGLVDLVAMLASRRTQDGAPLDIAMTTNGSALRALARPLADAGLGRVTVSLDSLDDETFRRMNGVDFPVAKVLDGIAAAVEAGLGPVKVNVVLKRGENDGGILGLARWARAEGHILRFIEYMDVGTTNGWRLDEVVPAREVIDGISREWPLEPAEAGYPGEVATRWRYLDGGGEIGVISSVTRPFCGDCTRARISAEGKLYTCLFSAVGHDLREPLRSGASDADLADHVAAIWNGRDDRYSELRAAATTDRLPKIEMFALGG
jgi:cyclic pyranopterin phosphate synthase